MRVPLLLLLASLTFLAGLGRPAVGDVDEGFYAEAAREMVESGDWLTPHFNYEHRFQKPVLYYWLTAATFRVTGVTPGGARLWAALAGIGLVLLVYACGRRWYGPGTALLAGAIAATNFGYFEIARQALPDLPLTFFITLAIWAAFRSLALPAPADGPAPAARGWLLTASAAAALGFLTKGPLALVVPALVVPPALAWEWWSRGRRPGTGLTPGDWLLAALVFVVLAAPWYAAMAREHGIEYLYRFFIGENVERFATDRFNEPRPVWFYLPVLLGGLLPWSGYLLLAGGPALRVFRQGCRPETARLIVWTVVPLVFFTLSIGKQPRYILPVLPPLAILLARAILSRRREPHGAARDPLARAATALCGGILLFLAALLWRAAPLFEAAGLPLVTLAAGLTALAGAGVVAAAGLTPHRMHPGAVAAAALVTLLALQYGVMSSPHPDPVERMASMVRQAHYEGQAVGVYGVFNRNLPFYTGLRQVDIFNDEQLVNFLGAGEPVLCVLPAEALAPIERHAGIELQVLGEVRYLNTANLRPATILQPDPARDLRRVLLVSNR